MFTDCPGCAERREKMKATMAALVGWVTRASPASAPPPTAGTAKIPVVQTSAPRPPPVRKLGIGLTPTPPAGKEGQ